MRTLGETVDRANMGSEPGIDATKDTGAEVLEISRFLERLSPEQRERYLARLRKTPEQLAQEETERIRSAAAAEKRRQEARRARIRKTCGLCEQDRGCSLDGFKLYAQFPKRNEVYRIGRYWLERIPELRKSLLIWGESGRSKSYFVKALANAAMAKDRPIDVFYCNCFELEDLLRRWRDHGDGQTLKGRMTSCELLVLDDIEKGLAGDAAKWVRALLKEVLDYVDAHGAPLLLATSQAPLDSKDPKATTHRKCLPEWLYGRLAKIFFPIEMVGPNYRLVQAQENGDWIDEAYGRR